MKNLYAKKHYMLNKHQFTDSFIWLTELLFDIWCFCFICNFLLADLRLKQRETQKTVWF